MILKTCSAAIAALVLSAAANGANATIFCELKATSDGFVALRAGPSKNARVIGKMKAEDHLQSLMEEKGKWARIEHFHQECYVEAGNPHGEAS